MCPERRSIFFCIACSSSGERPLPSAEVVLALVVLALVVVEGSDRTVVVVVVVEIQREVLLVNSVQMIAGIYRWSILYILTIHIHCYYNKQHYYIYNTHIHYTLTSTASRFLGLLLFLQLAQLGRLVDLIGHHCSLGALRSDAEA